MTDPLTLLLYTDQLTSFTPTVYKKMYIFGANDKLAEWLPDGAETWEPDELRDYVLEANISASYIDQLLDYLDYEYNDLQEDDFWIALQNWVFVSG